MTAREYPYTHGDRASRRPALCRPVAVRAYRLSSTTPAKPLWYFRMPRRWWVDLLNPWNLVLLILWIPVNLVAVPTQALINGLSGSPKRELIGADTCIISLDGIELFDRDSPAGVITPRAIVGVTHHRNEVEIRTLGDHYWIVSADSVELFQAIQSMLAPQGRGLPKESAPHDGRHPPGKASPLPPKPRRRVRVLIGIVVLLAFAIVVSYLSHGYNKGISGHASELSPSSAGTQTASEPANEAAPDGPNEPSTADPLSQLNAEVESSQGTAAGMLDRWVPELSAKQQGTEDDGVIYDYSSILSYHASLRARYGEIMTVRSVDYQSFTYPGYWVALLPKTFPSGDAVNDWCIAEGWDPDHLLREALVSHWRPG